MGQRKRIRILAPRMGMLATLCLTGCSAGLSPTAFLSSEPPIPTVGRDAPGQYVFRASQYAFTTDFELSPEDPLVRDLASLRDEVFRALELPPSDAPIRIVIFDSQQAYHQFLQTSFPNLPDRRAFFIQEGSDALAVFTCRGDRLKEDLRHEVTHALLHSAIADVPIWLDEGLAEYFETSGQPGAVNPAHARKLRQALPQGWVPDLARLERLRDLWQMTQDDYRESWLWVHYLMRHSSDTRRILIEHVRDLAQGRSGSLCARLIPDASHVDPALLDHLNSLGPYLRE